ncbi:mRNA splicing factor [Phaffia rhodozyma]|uniref:mRNA splicing factor n=1 Tax=Phaffia rhodozyma TaxID=264483 RepID=A0A0F7SN01_PHARH|nr:mRNA splicing factor [Phaffia rhodozyma]
MSEAPKFTPGSLYAGISFSQSAESSGSSSSNPSTNVNADSANAPKKNWSTALAFAPIRRAPAQKPKPPRPSAALFFTPTPNASSGSKSTDIVREAAPVIHKPRTDPSISNSRLADQTYTRALPSLTLEEDINGFNKRLNPSSSAYDSAQAQANKKKKKRKNRGNPSEQNRATFNPLELYDPAKPNDIEEYTRWKAEEKKRKERIRREKKEYARKIESESESSYYTEDEEEEELERARTGRYIGQPPPASYSTTTPSSNAFPVFQPSTSHSNPLQSDLDPSAPSFTPASIAATGTLPPPPSLVVPPQASLSGEEAYLRRAALSSLQQPTVSSDAPREAVSIPSFSSSSSSSSVPTGAAPSGIDSEEFQRKVEERKRAAAAIAARFAKPASGVALAGNTEGNLSTPPPPKVERDPNDNRDFATRMMDKWGHKTGEGLGVDASGITNPLQIAQTSKPKAKLSSSSDAPFQPRAMGKVISETTSRKNAEDLARFGESSRIVLLMHMVGSVEEVDDELSQDIAEECGKFGVVERVVIHEVHPTPSRPEDSVRVFVVFSGPAGAWTAIRALDDRFFGGRSIKARYFSENKFDRGDRDN